MPSLRNASRAQYWSMMSTFRSIAAVPTTRIAAAASLSSVPENRTSANCLLWVTVCVTERRRFGPLDAFGFGQCDHSGAGGQSLEDLQAFPFGQTAGQRRQIDLRLFLQKKLDDGLQADGFLCEFRLERRTLVSQRARLELVHDLFDVPHVSPNR